MDTIIENTASEQAKEEEEAARSRRLRFARPTKLFLVLVLSLAFFLASLTFLLAMDDRPSYSVPVKPVSGTNADYVALRDLVLQEFGAVDKDLKLKLLTPSTSEFKAFQWMLVKDTLIPKTTQRFAVASIFLHFGLSLSSNNPECEWEGIGCTKNIKGYDTVTSFTAKNSIGGSLPVSLAYLSDLQKVDLSNQQLKGSVPTAYLSLSKLQHLNIEQNLLTFAIHNNIGNRWAQLQVLKASNNLLSETIPSSVSNLTNLRELDVQGNVELSGRLFEYAAPHWQAIEKIEIAQTSISGSIPDGYYTSFQKLQTLAASNTQLTGSLPVALATAASSSLDTVVLAHLNFTGSSLPREYGSLTALTQFVVVNCGISGSLSASWGQLSKLQALDIFANSITGTIPTEWGLMTDLQVMRIADTQLSGTIPTELGRIAALQDLTAYHTDLTGTMPAEVCALRDNVLARLTADCAGDNPLVQCSSPDCCTNCYQHNT